MKFFNQLSLLIKDLLKYSKRFGILFVAILFLIFKSPFSNFENFCNFCNLLMVLLCFTYSFLCRHYTHPPDPVTMAVGLVTVLIVVMLSVTKMKKKDWQSFISYLCVILSLIFMLLGDLFGVPI